MRQVGARAECRGCAGDDDRADALVSLEPVEGLDDLVDHLEIERVAPLRVVKRDDRDAVGDFGSNKSHASTSLTTAGEWRKKFSTSRS